MSEYPPEDGSISECLPLFWIAESWVGDSAGPNERPIMELEAGDKVIIDMVKKGE